jgi:two-component system, cell cycle response regulator
VNRSVRFGHPLCVMVLDLDRFKEVNDSHGHAAGDAVLVEFARRLSAEIRGVDRAFRYGGEEFVLLLPETDGIGGITLAQRLGAAVREASFTIPGGRDLAGVRAEPTVDTPISVTVSIGVAVLPTHGASPTEILEAADDALYAAKAAGRDTYRLAVSRAVDRGIATEPAETHQKAEPDSALDVAVEDVAAAIGGPISSGGIGRWRGRGGGRAGDKPSGGASGGASPPRQTRGR